MDIYNPAELLAPQANVNEWLAEPPAVGKWARKFYREYVGIADEEELREHWLKFER